MRGDDGIPYLYADSLAHALVGQGFLHALDRLFSEFDARYAIGSDDWRPAHRGANRQRTTTGPLI